MKYVITEKNNINNIIINSNGFDFKTELDFSFSFEVLTTDNSTCIINVFNNSKLPKDFENITQAVPLSVFMENHKSRFDHI